MIDNDRLIVRKRKVRGRVRWQVVSGRTIVSQHDTEEIADNVAKAVRDDRESQAIRSAATEEFSPI